MSYDNWSKLDGEILCWSLILPSILGPLYQKFKILTFRIFSFSLSLQFSTRYKFQFFLLLFLFLLDTYFTHMAVLLFLLKKESHMYVYIQNTTIWEFFLYFYIPKIILSGLSKKGSFAFSSFFFYSYFCIFAGGAFFFLVLYFQHDYKVEYLLFFVSSVYTL